ncbi:MAG: hypothetical protein M1834_005025 [Cirrosporium novae-zelandiae]|nr:MAG: hypothetical protein M1834_005025 [Cirrosporium novae-zelandiae]
MVPGPSPRPIVLPQNTVRGATLPPPNRILFPERSPYLDGQVNQRFVLVPWDIYRGRSDAGIKPAQAAQSTRASNNVNSRPLLAKPALGTAATIDGRRKQQSNISKKPCNNHCVAVEQSETSSFDEGEWSCNMVADLPSSQRFSSNTSSSCRPKKVRFDLPPEDDPPRSPCFSSRPHTPPPPHHHNKWSSHPTLAAPNYFPYHTRQNPAHRNNCPRILTPKRNLPSQTMPTFPNTYFSSPSSSSHSSSRISSLDGTVAVSPPESEDNDWLSDLGLNSDDESAIDPTCWEEMIVNGVRNGDRVLEQATIGTTATTPSFLPNVTTNARSNAANSDIKFVPHRTSTPAMASPTFVHHPSHDNDAESNSSIGVDPGPFSWAPEEEDPTPVLSDYQSDLDIDSPLPLRTPSSSSSDSGIDNDFHHQYFSSSPGSPGNAPHHSPILSTWSPPETRYTPFIYLSPDHERVTSYFESLKGDERVRMGDPRRNRYMVDPRSGIMYIQQDVPEW